MSLLQHRLDFLLETGISGANSRVSRRKTVSGTLVSLPHWPQNNGRV